MPGHKQVNSQNDICSTILVTERNLALSKSVYESCHKIQDIY